MNKTQAEAIAHTLSKPSKMPGYSYGLPAAECKVGSRLRNVPDSVCHGCYALKGFYATMPSVKPAQYKRLTSITHPQWTNAMVALIARKGPHFRWHDSGDIQSLEHLRRIVEVVKRTPHIQHWMPTREYRTVKAYRALYGPFPSNLVVRLSAHKVDSAPPSSYGLPTSTVSTNGAATCPAPKQGNECRDCRDCWDPNVANVAYKAH